jgi:hypothetical protein
MPQLILKKKKKGDSKSSRNHFHSSTTRHEQRGDKNHVARVMRGQASDITKQNKYGRRWRRLNGG